MPLGKRKDGTTTGPSREQRAQKSREVGSRPLRRVVAAGVAWGVEAGRSEHADVDVLECGHVLSGAKDLIGRRWLARRRRLKCASGQAPDLSLPSAATNARTPP